MTHKTLEWSKPNELQVFIILASHGILLDGFPRPWFRPAKCI